MKNQLIEEGIQWSTILTIPTIPVVRMEKLKLSPMPGGSINDLNPMQNATGQKLVKVNPCITGDQQFHLMFISS